VGIFGDLDMESASSSAWPSDDTYSCVLTDATVGPSKKTEDKPKAEQDIFWVLTYTVQEGNWAGFEITERKRILIPADPENPTPDEKRSIAYNRKRLESLGIPESRMNDVTNEDLIGIECAVKIRGNKDDNYPPNVVHVELLTEQVNDDPWTV